ncbi:epidermal growth factor-like protein 6 [Drosophila tropicalis]|uniref:epidermal growth factor-like protein 6 n=1 Tax=Drosophila tropicalis TaxID=46794 RepID=UPI0035AC0104
MNLTQFYLGVFIAILYCLPVFGQFWRNALSERQHWEREMLASRQSGICYRMQSVETIDPDLRYRQISYCCDGFLNLGTNKNLKCEPICKMDCTNGICIGPDNCECAPGYVLQNERCKSYDED